MSAPQRIQLHRTAGWRKPEGAVVVSRPSRWGNPFAIQIADCAMGGRCWRVITPDGQLWAQHLDTRGDAARAAVDLFALHIGPMGSYEYDQETLERLTSELAGRDLACWCPPGQPCHADVLLEIANTTTH